jgi:hypothetical protein
MPDPFSDVHQSFNRCLQRRDFLRRFYRLFTDSHPDIAARFRETDWDKQIHLLRHGISASILYASGGSLGHSELAELHESHGPKGHDIPGWMYDYWLEALVEALAETDPQWSPPLRARWREAMGHAIARIRPD